MTNKKLLSILLGISFLLGGCTFNDTYYAPCEGKFGSQKVIDSIKRTLGLENIYFNNYYKNPGTIPTNCDTVRMEIFGDNISGIVNGDAFVQTISKIFFTDSANKGIKYLKLHVEDIELKIGKMETMYVLDKNSSINNNSLNVAADTNNEYKIVKVTPYTKISNGRSEESLRVDVSLHAEPIDMARLADEIKQKYKTEIQQKSLDEFSIYFSIEKPNNKYCVSKLYSVYYRKENNEL